MATCTRNPNHVYPDHNAHCPWCLQTATAATHQTALPPISAPPVPRSPDPAPAPRPVPQSFTQRPAAAQPPAPVSGSLLVPKAPPDSHRAFANGTFIVWLATALTVVIPWLLGAFVLRDSFGRPHDALVNDTTARANGTYFGTDYLAGLTLTTALAGALLIVSAMANPRRRIGRLFVGAVLAAGAIAGLAPVAVTTWHDAELATAQDLATTTHYGGCSTESSTYFAGEAGIPHNWTAVVPDTSGRGGGLFDSTPSVCDTIEVWDGNVLVTSIPAPQILTKSLTLNPGATPADTWGTFLTPGPPYDCGSETCAMQYVVINGFPLTGNAVGWTATLFSSTDSTGGLGYEYVYPSGPYLMALEHALTDASVVTALSAATGQVAFQARCPAEAPRAGQFYVDDQGPVVLCFVPNGFDKGGNPTDHYTVNTDGTLTLRPPAP